MTGKKRKRPFKRKASPGGHFNQVKQRLGIRKIVVLLIVVAISSAAVAIFLHFSQPAKAALVDHLGLTFPNQSFINTATEILEQAGYEVDYYPGEEVTVGFYQNLLRCGYELIVLRVHSSATTRQGEELVECPVGIFTSEPYSPTEYVDAQIMLHLAAAKYPRSKGPFYFAILPGFVAANTKDRPQNTTILMMGCEGLTNTKMAEAFVEEGAEAYIGWNGSVSASHTDQATIHLLTHLLTENQTIEEAVETTMTEVGPDPTYNSILLYYPP